MRSKFFWVALLYFAEGFPLGIYYELFPVYFRQQGVDLAGIGLLSLLGLAWTLKFLWAPAIDHFRSHRLWMAGADLAMGAVMLLFAFAAGFGPWVWAAIGLFTVLSATNDIAIDGYTIELLERDEMGLANGLRIGFYRVGMLASGFVLILSDWIRWPGAFAAAALAFLAVALACRLAPPERAAPRARAASLARELTIVDALAELLSRRGIVPVLVFILIFKLGDAAMGFMVKPFWVDAGFSATAIGLVSVNVGLALSIAGGLAGGWYADRAGIFRALWVLGLFQALSNAGYAIAAGVIPIGQGLAPLPEHRVLLYAASAFESFTGGLGTAAFLAFLMAIVDQRRSATQYALLSSVFALSRSLAGWAGGIGAQEMGYATYFLLTVFLSFPAYAFLPWVARMLRATAPGSAREQTACG
ncbi:MAG: MFS transporter [Burkholderiales bacterium]|nr:MFS transporter [Burkholderiales bacterium]